jgi:hypothetical protein
VTATKANIDELATLPDQWRGFPAFSAVIMAA